MALLSKYAAMNNIICGWFSFAKLQNESFAKGNHSNRVDLARPSFSEILLKVDNIVGKRRLVFDPKLTRMFELCSLTTKYLPLYRRNFL